MLIMSKKDSENDSEQKPEKYFADQFDNEEVLYVFHKHPIVMRKGFVLGMGKYCSALLPT